MTTRMEMVDAILAQDWELLATEDYQACAQKLKDSLVKAKNRPKEKTTARIQNETYAQQLADKLAEYGKPATAKWFTTRIRYLTNSQKVVKVAEVAKELELIKIVRNDIGCFYLLPNWDEEWEWKDLKKIQ